MPTGSLGAGQGLEEYVFFTGGRHGGPTVYVGTEWREKKLRSVFEGFKKHQKRT